MALLVGLVLAAGVSVVPTLVPFSPCPKCLGRGLLQEPPTFEGTARWMASKDLIPLECDQCLDHGKVSLLKKWRWREQGFPVPPVYRASDLRGFTERRLERMSKLRHDATAGTGGHPPTAPSSRVDLLPVLAGALEDEHEDVRRQAAWTLSYMNHPETLPLLLRSLTHPDDRVQAIACTGLGWLGRAESLRGQIKPALTQMYDADAKRDFAVRLEAASILLDWGDIREPSLFLEAIKRGYATRPEVRKAIVRFERKDAVLLLIKHLATYAPKAEASNECAQALEHLTGEHFGSDAVAWYRWFEKNRSSLPDQLE